MLASLIRLLLFLQEEKYLLGHTVTPKQDKQTAKVVLIPRNEDGKQEVNVTYSPPNKSQKEVWD